MRATRMMGLGLALALGGAGAWSMETALAQDAPAAPAADEASRLVAALGATDFDAREAAEKRLVALGDAALPALRRAAESDDAEVQRRARRALQRIADKGKPHRPDPFQVPRGWQRVPDERDDRDPGDDAWRDAFGGRDPLGGMGRLWKELFDDLGVDEPADPDARGERNPDDPFELFRRLLPHRGGERDPMGGLDRLLERLREGGFGFEFGPADPDRADEWHEQMRQAHERMRQMQDEMRRVLEGQDPFGGADPFGQLPRLGELFGRARERGGEPRGGTSRSVSVQGDGSVTAELIEGDTRITVAKSADGAIEVTVTAPDEAGASQTREWSAANEAELRAKHAEAAEHYDRAMGGLQTRPGGLRYAPLDRWALRLGPRTQRTRSARGQSSAALGLRIEPLGDALRSQLTVPAGQGIYVAAVEPNGWAARAGLQAYDVVLAVNGEPMRGLEDLESARRTAAVADDATLALAIIRAGARQTLSVKAR